MARQQNESEGVPYQIAVRWAGSERMLTRAVSRQRAYNWRQTNRVPWSAIGPILVRRFGEQLSDSWDDRNWRRAHWSEFSDLAKQRLRAWQVVNPEMTPAIMAALDSTMATMATLLESIAPGDPDAIWRRIWHDQHATGLAQAATRESLGKRNKRR